MKFNFKKTTLDVFTRVAFCRWKKCHLRLLITALFDRTRTIPICRQILIVFTDNKASELLLRFCCCLVNFLCNYHLKIVVRERSGQGTLESIIEDVDSGGLGTCTGWIPIDYHVKWWTGPRWTSEEGGDARECRGLQQYNRICSCWVWRVK